MSLFPSWAAESNFSWYWHLDLGDWLPARPRRDYRQLCRFLFFLSSVTPDLACAGNVRQALGQLWGVHSRQNRTQCSLCPSCPVARGPWVWVPGHVGPLTVAPAESRWQVCMAGLRSVSGVSEALAPAGVVGAQQTSADEWNLHSSKRLLGFQRWIQAMGSSFPLPCVLFCSFLAIHWKYPYHCGVFVFLLSSLLLTLTRKKTFIKMVLKSASLPFPPSPTSPPSLAPSLPAASLIPSFIPPSPFPFSSYLRCICLMYMSVCLCVCMGVTWVAGALRGWSGKSDRLELESQMVVIYYMGAEDWSLVFQALPVVLTVGHSLSPHFRPCLSLSLATSTYGDWTLCIEFIKGSWDSLSGQEASSRVSSLPLTWRWVSLRKSGSCLWLESGCEAGGCQITAFIWSWDVRGVQESCPWGLSHTHAQMCSQAVGAQLSFTLIGCATWLTQECAGMTDVHLFLVEQTVSCLNFSWLTGCSAFSGHILDEWVICPRYLLSLLRLAPPITTPIF